MQAFRFWSVMGVMWGSLLLPSVCGAQVQPVSPPRAPTAPASVTGASVIAHSPSHAAALTEMDKSFSLNKKAFMSMMEEMYDEDEEGGKPAQPSNISSQPVVNAPTAARSAPVPRNLAPAQGIAPVSSIPPVNGNANSKGMTNR